MSDFGQLFRLLFIVLVILVINGIKRAGRDARNRRRPEEPGSEPSPTDVFRTSEETVAVPPRPPLPKRRAPTQRPAGAASRRADVEGEGSRRRPRQERGDEEGPGALRRSDPRGQGEGRPGDSEGPTWTPAMAAPVPRAAVSRSREPKPPSRAHRLIAETRGGLRRVLLLGEILGPPGGRS